MNRLKSQLDRSVNLITKFKNGEIEARCVQKTPDYISAYVSSHNGCRMKCEMCWLTATGQDNFDHVDIPTYRSQLESVLSDYRKHSLTQTATRCNVNFMARGEALANKFVINQYPRLYDTLAETTASHNLTMKPNVSTIMPYTVKNRKLTDIFPVNKPAYIYYSLYSTDPTFRKRWLPNAIDHRLALDKLKEYQVKSNNIITFHWSYIKGHNDSVEEAHRIRDLLKSYNFNGKLNIVRFNPPENSQEVEPEEGHIERLFGIISPIFAGNKNYIVPRVGKDVYASCGMFVSGIQVYNY